MKIFLKTENVIFQRSGDSWHKLRVKMGKLTTMQRKKAIRLMLEWTNRVCMHPNIEKEYCLEKETGNKVCTVCGHTIYHFNEEKTLQSKIA